MFDSDTVLSFVNNVIGPVFRLADPLGCCTVNVFRDGWGHAWHYDEASFSVTIPLQQAKSGGLFQIRTEGGQVETLALDPGALLLFAGSKYLHRCGQLAPSRARD